MFLLCLFARGHYVKNELIFCKDIMFNFLFAHRRNYVSFVLVCKGEFFFKQMKVHTDGSALLFKGWPAAPVNAGWGLVFVCAASLGEQAVPLCFMGPSGQLRPTQ